MADFEIERPSVELNQVNPTFNVNPPQFTIEIHGSIQGQRGEKGDKGDAGEPGRDGIDGINGIDGVDGEDGVGVESIVQTSTSHESGGTNIITATLTDGTETTFEIMNGEAGSTAQIKKFEFNDILDITSTSDEIYQELNECIANKEPFFITSGDDTHQVVYSYKYNNTLKIYYFATQTDMTTITLTGSPTVTVTYSDIYYQKLINQNNKLDYSYLSNTPTIPDELSDLSDDTTHRLVTDTEKSTWGGKQDALVSGTNIKTINNNSILGSGDLTIQPIFDATFVDEAEEQGINLTNEEYQSLIDAYIDGQIFKINGMTATVSVDGSGNVTLEQILDNIVCKYDISSTNNNHTITFDTITLATSTDLASKQNTLVSGTNIKTINNESLLGSGNIDIQGSQTDVQINGSSIVSNDVANIQVEGTYNASTNKIATMSEIPTKVSDLSNDTGFITSSSLPTKVSDLSNDSGFISSETDPVFSASAAAGIDSGDISTWNGKQDALVSGTNIKTINNNSILGSGNITISGGGGTPTDVRINGTSITSNNVADIITETSYDSSTNKIATVSDLPTKTSDLTNDSNFISGLVMLTYDSSTWQDFQNAYNSNKIVYCKVGGRMAFLAYVEATKVEFQYYRSLGSPSVSNQVDEVYVYALTSANKWTTTTRKASSTIAVGTGLSKSYTANSRTMTLSVDTSTMAQKSDLPTKTSDLTNDSGFITGYTETDPVFTASAAYGISSSDITTWNNKSDFSGDYDDLTNKPTIPTVPTNVSSFTNDAGYITGYTETDPVFSASAAHGITSTDITNWNNKSNFSGNYNDLTNKPTIPTVNNATLTIQKNGTTVKTFTANASSNVTANITVPTKTSDITNDSGYITGITSSDIYNVLGYYPAAEPNIYTYNSIIQITSTSNQTYIDLMDDIANNRPIIIKLGTTEYVNALGTNNGTTTSLWFMTSDNDYTKITLTVSGTAVTTTHETIEIPTITLSSTTWIDSLF